MVEAAIANGMSAMDHPAREAIAHVTKNDKRAVQKAVDAGCDWLPALQKELAAAEKAKK